MDGEREAGEIREKIEHTADEAKQRGKEALVEIVDDVKDKAGDAKDAWGSLTGEARDRAEGMADEIKGRAKQAFQDAANYKDPPGDEDVKRGDPGDRR